MTGYEAYCLHLAIKNHFERDSYDFFKYRGKVSAKQDTFLGRRDRWQFEKLGKRYSDEDLKSLYVANAISIDSRGWVGRFSEARDEADALLTEYQKRIQSLDYVFRNELSEVEFSPESLRVVDGQMPILFRKFMAGDVSLETLVVLEDLFPHWNNILAKVHDTVLFPKIIRLARKYGPFLERDRRSLRNIFVKHLESAI